MSNDWIKWNGETAGYIGGKPSANGTVVDVIFRNGMVRTSTVDDFNWSYAADSTDAADIVSYRISDSHSINPETLVENGEVKPALPCCCLPGQCRGQVVDGRLPNGDRCKQEFAKSVWFEWKGTTSNLTPRTFGDRFAIEWELNNGICGNGIASDPHWTFAPENPIAVKRYRWTDPRVMLLDPYTGRMRHPIDIMQDPEGWKVDYAGYEKQKSILPEPTRIPPMPPLCQRPRNETFSDDLEATKAVAKTAPDLLDAAAGHMRDRAATYDKPEGERSMAATVQAFNAITGRDLRESEGWLLMAILKMVRSETRGTPHRDSVEDLIAYAGLYGEARIGGV